MSASTHALTKTPAAQVPSIPTSRIITSFLVLAAFVTMTVMLSKSAHATHKPGPIIGATIFAGGSAFVGGCTFVSLYNQHQLKQASSGISSRKVSTVPA